MAAMSKRKNIKAELLAAASRQFYQRGYTAASVKEIVEECGTTAPALYHHFGSKRGLALAYLEACAADQAQCWQPVFRHATLPEIIAAWMAAVRRDTARSDYLGCPIGNLSAQLNLSAGGDADQIALRQRLAEIMESWIRGLTGRLGQLKSEAQIHAEADSQDLATQMLNAYEGSLLLWRTTSRTEIIDALEHQLRAIGQRAIDPSVPGL